MLNKYYAIVHDGVVVGVSSLYDTFISTGKEIEIQDFDVSLLGKRYDSKKKLFVPVVPVVTEKLINGEVL